MSSGAGTPSRRPRRPYVALVEPVARSRRAGGGARAAGPFVVGADGCAGIRVGAARPRRLGRPDVGYEEWAAGTDASRVGRSAHPPQAWHGGAGEHFEQELPPSERAAVALERIARRVRAGEIGPLVLLPRHGDAGILASVLAALLAPVR